MPTVFLLLLTSAKFIAANSVFVSLNWDFCYYLRLSYHDVVILIVEKIEIDKTFS